MRSRLYKTILQYNHYVDETGIMNGLRHNVFVLVSSEKRKVIKKHTPSSRFLDHDYRVCLGYRPGFNSIVDFQK